MGRFDVKKWLSLILLIFSLVVIVMVAFALNDIFGEEVSEESYFGALDYEAQLKTVYINGEAYMPRKGVTTLLIIGVDKEGEAVSSGSYNNSERSDFLALLVFDDNNKTYKLLHINRDTMFDIPMLDISGNRINATRFAQLALAHTYGDGLISSCRNTAEAVSEFLYGANVENYVSVTMGAVPILNDYVGGVTVTFEEDMTAADPTFVKGTTLTLRGQQALRFVRARGELEDSTNISRMERQKQYIAALVKTVSEKDIDDTFFIGACEQIASYSVTNCSTAFMNLVGYMLQNYEYVGAVSPKGESVVNEFMEFYVDEDSLKEILVDLFFDRVEVDE